ncbi:hypothetical protein SAMD00023353_0403110 [Rosellinia necatrix]|uniref:Uncharacterized protein n=1 Tax=Rosellinia necatrix TaxID=77044 RepID=A0A1S8A5C6_ROSNE|nr:hypothetical protein SAMD00023353_0403110 [Rosellinia necatrix]
MIQNGTRLTIRLFLIPDQPRSSPDHPYLHLPIPAHPFPIPSPSSGISPQAVPMPAHPTRGWCITASQQQQQQQKQQQQSQPPPLPPPPSLPSPPLPPPPPPAAFLPFFPFASRPFSDHRLPNGQPDRLCGSRA